MRTRAVIGLLALLVAGGLLFLPGGSAQAAATRTWTGLGATNNWSEAANWNTGVPVAGDSLVFPSVASRKINVNDLAANTSFADITFTGSGYSISGSALQVAGNLVNDPESGSNSVSLDIGGAGGVKQLSGRLSLSGDNTFDADVDIEEGVLVANSDSALGGEPGITVVSAGATLQLPGGIDPGTEGMSLAGTGFDGFGALQAFNGGNVGPDVNISVSATVGVANGTLVFESLSGNGSLTLVGGGKLQVDATPFGGFPGPVHVVEGNLTWNAPSSPAPAIDVQQQGLLRGMGTVSSVSVVSGGAVWPGSGSQPGILSAGGVTFTAGVFKVDVDGPDAGPGYGQLMTSGLTLNSPVTILDLDLGFAPSVGQVFRIVNNTGGGPVLGAFLNLPEGAVFGAGGFAFRISYKGGNGNDVTLTVLRQLTADLKLTAEAAPSPVANGATLVYTLTVTDQGPDSASSPTLSMGTPVGATFESATGPTGWTCSKPNSSPSVQCTGPSMPAGATAQLILRFKVNAGAAGNITGSAGVSSQTNDSASANNSATVVTPVGAGGALPFRRFLPGIARDAVASSAE